MRALAITVSLLAPALVLAGCATPQENPNYQFSSTYTGVDDRAATRSVAYSVPAAPTAPTYATPSPATPSYGDSDVYTRVDTDCLAAGGCAPQGMSAHAAPIVSEPWASPTEELFVGGETTPGFRAVEGRLSGETAMPAPSPTPSYEAAAPIPDVPAPAAPMSSDPVPSAPRIDAEPNTLTISGPIVAAEALSGTRTRALMHRVQTGDTVYSLARDYCTSVDAIASMNGLGADYAIGLGADLKLPANCQ